MDVAEVAASYIPPTTSGSLSRTAGQPLVRLLDGGGTHAAYSARRSTSARHSVWLHRRVLFRPRLPHARRPRFVVRRAGPCLGPAALDIRVIFWRHQSRDRARTGASSPARRPNARCSASRGARFQRPLGPRPGEPFCHHQKTWLIDAGQPSETAFVGGINLTRRAVVLPGTSEARHDVYVEVTGPSASDVHHNFVQRWNEASDSRAGRHGAWGHDGNDELAFPARVTAGGASVVQIQAPCSPAHATRIRARRWRARLRHRRRRALDPRPVPAGDRRRPPFDLHREPGHARTRVVERSARRRRPRCRRGGRRCRRSRARRPRRDGNRRSARSSQLGGARAVSITSR